MLALINAEADGPTDGPAGLPAHSSLLGLPALPLSLSQQLWPKANSIGTNDIAITAPEAKSFASQPASQLAGHDIIGRIGRAVGRASRRRWLFGIRPDWKKRGERAEQQPEREKKMF